MKTIDANIKILINLLMLMLSIIPPLNDAEASSCIDIGAVSGHAVAVRLATTENYVVLGLPRDGKVMIFELKDRNAIKLKHIVEPPTGNLFSSNHTGFGHSVAVNGDRVVIGAYRIETSVPQGRDKALEYPKGLFITSEVFFFNVRTGSIEVLAVGDQNQASGYSVASAGGTVAWSIFEKPAPSDIPLSLFHASSGGVMVRDIKNGEHRSVKAPIDARGFGFALASTPDGYLILAPFGKPSEVFRFKISGSDSGVSIVTGLRSPLFANLVESNSFMAISTGELFSTTEAATIVIPNNGKPLTLSHGGRLSASDNLLAIVQPAMPEGAPEPVLYLYRKLNDGVIKLIKVDKGVIGAAVIGDGVITVSRSFTGRLRLCVD
jgi:hypothetical protein